MPTVVSEDWYLDSCWREGTHYGRFDNGTVTARCGLEFTPEQGLFGTGDAAIAVVPMQSQQACRKCCAEVGVRVEDVEQPPPNQGRRRDPLSLGTWVRREPGTTALPPPVPAAPITPSPEPATTPAPDQQPPPGDGETDAKPRSRWFQKSTKPGDTHWVITMGRGTKVAVCGESFQGKRVKSPASAQICPRCHHAAG